MMRHFGTFSSGLAAGLVLAATVPLLAQVGGADLPYTFSAGSTASADQVNANFQALADDNDALRARVEDLEVFIADLRTHLSVGTDAQGNPAVVISGANLRVNNGTGDTDTANGTSNIVIGYDERRPSGTSYDPECSDGSETTESACVSGGDVWALNHKSGSHNLVIGTLNNYAQYGGLVVGEANSITGRFTSVSGGRSNQAMRPYASVSGGWENRAAGFNATVSAGRRNTAYGSNASIAGGFDNASGGEATHVSGGRDGAALGDYSTVVGGESGATNGDYSVVGGGDSTIASGSHAIAP